MKLAPRLILSFTAVVLIMVGVSAYSIYFIQDAMLRVIGHKMTALTERTLEITERDLYNRAEVFRQFSFSSEVHNFLEQSNLEFEQMPDREKVIDRTDEEWTHTPNPLAQQLTHNELSVHMREITSFYRNEYSVDVYPEVFLTNRYGVNIAQTNKTSDYRQNDEDWWRKAAEEDIYISDVTYDKSSETYSTDVCMAIHADNGDLLGVLKLILNTDNTFHILREMEKDLRTDAAYRSAHFSLLDSRNRVLYSPHHGHEFLQKIPDFDIAALKAQAIHKNFLLEHNFHGDNEYFSHAHSREYYKFPSLKWTLLLAVERQEVLAPIRALQKHLFIILAIGLILSCYIGLVISRAVVNPIQRLIQFAQKAGCGDLDIQIDMPSTGNDEISELAIAFSGMAEDLSKLIENEKELSARAARMELEQERAEELEKARSERTKKLRGYDRSHRSFNRDGPSQVESPGRGRRQVNND